MNVAKIETGHILINPRGRVRVVRTRNKADNGWNCNDGNPISDAEAEDPKMWTPFTQDELAAALQVAAQIAGLSNEPLMAGGLRTWDACSGRPCVLPRLADVARDANRDLPVAVHS